MTIKLHSSIRPLCIVSSYLPCCSGCTDSFKEAFDYADSLLHQLSFDSDVLFLGDLNADPGPEGGPLATTVSNKQGRILLRYLRKWNYLSVHLHSCISSSSHTYLSEAHGSCSSIDHILSPAHLLPRFSDCNVLDDVPLNLSDHVPICAVFSFSCPRQTSSARTRVSSNPVHRPNWAKLSKEELSTGYTATVGNQLSNLSLPDLSTLTQVTSNIDFYLSKVSDILLLAAQKHVPPKCFVPHRKRQWNIDLKQAHSRSKKAYKVWVAAG